MKSFAFMVVTLTLVPSARAVATNPLSTTIALLDDLAAKVKADGAAADKAAADYAKWCTGKIRDLGFDIKTGMSLKVELMATIEKMTANIEVTSSKIVELGASVTKDDTELKEAESVRAAEKADFLASEKELLESIDALSRAIAILEKEMSKNPAFVQMDTTDVTKMVQSISAVVSAAGFSSVDQQRLVALVQAQQGAEDGDEELAAPAAAAYKTHSKSIFDVLEDLKEKAEVELSDLRKAEASAAHKFAMLKQGLVDSVEADSKRLVESKSFKMSFSQTKAVAKGDLSVCVKGLTSDEETLKNTKVKCEQVAADHVADQKARAEEIKAIEEAKKILEETTVGAEKQTYSFLQVRSKRLSSQLQSHATLSSSEVITLVKKLAKEHHSAALAQLASRISTVFRYGAETGEDPFVKVKGLISDLIAKLEKEASEEAGEKAFCDSELAKTKAKIDDLSTEIDSLTSKIDMATSRSAKLKGQVKQIQAELASLAKSQAEADRIRSEQHADYVTAKKDLELGLLGVRKALTVLRDFYGGASLLQQPAEPESYSKSKGAGGSIVDILEVVESDFAKNLAAEETEEADAASAYEEMTQNNKVTTAEKSQDVKYKEKEFKALDKAIVDLSSDKDSTSTELAAVLDYEGKLTERCVAQPESYQERKARRDAEIAGLKEALSILESETAFVQSRKRGRQGHGHFFLSHSELEG